MVCLGPPGVLSNLMGQPIVKPPSVSSAQNRLPAFALVLGFRPCSSIRMLTEFSRQEHVPLPSIFQSISSGPGYALRRQPGGPERGGSSQPGWSCRGRRSYELLFDPSPYTHATGKSCAKVAQGVVAVSLKPRMPPALRSGSGLQRASRNGPVARGFLLKQCQLIRRCV